MTRRKSDRNMMTTTLAGKMFALRKRRGESASNSWKERHITSWLLDVGTPPL